MAYHSCGLNETVWSYVKLCGTVCNCVEPCVAVWTCVEPCGAAHVAAADLRRLTCTARRLTQMKLRQTDVPVADCFGNETVVDTTERGWREQIFQRIRVVFGYGC